MPDWVISLLFATLFLVLLLQVQTLSAIKSVVSRRSETTFKATASRVEASTSDLKAPEFPENRFKVRMPTELVGTLALAGKSWAVEFIDISETGVMLRCNEGDPLQVETSYSASIQLPTGLIKTECVVVRFVKEKGAYGARFGHLPLDAKGMIRNYVNSKASEELTRTQV